MMMASFPVLLVFISVVGYAGGKDYQIPVLSLSVELTFKKDSATTAVLKCSSSGDKPNSYGFYFYAEEGKWTAIAGCSTAETCAVAKDWKLGKMWWTNFICMGKYATGDIWASRSRMGRDSNAKTGSGWHRTAVSASLAYYLGGKSVSYGDMIDVTKEKCPGANAILSSDAKNLGLTAMLNRLDKSYTYWASSSASRNVMNKRAVLRLDSSENTGKLLKISGKSWSFKPASSDTALPLCFDTPGPAPENLCKSGTCKTGFKNIDEAKKSKKPVKMECSLDGSYPMIFFHAYNGEKFEEKSKGEITAEPSGDQPYIVTCQYMFQGRIYSALTYAVKGDPGPPPPPVGEPCKYSTDTEWATKKTECEKIIGGVKIDSSNSKQIDKLAKLTQIDGYLHIDGAKDVKLAELATISGTTENALPKEEGKYLPRVLIANVPSLTNIKKIFPKLKHVVGGDIVLKKSGDGQLSANDQWFLYSAFDNRGYQQLAVF